MKSQKTFEDFLLELEAPRPPDHQTQIEKIAWRPVSTREGQEGFTWNQKVHLESKAARIEKKKEKALTDEIPPKQSHRIFRKFGGVRALAKILEEIGLKRNVLSMYKWNYRGGHIPAHAWKDILKAAHYAGVRITSEDMDPRETFLNPKYLKAFPKKVKS